MFAGAGGLLYYSVYVCVCLEFFPINIKKKKILVDIWIPIPKRPAATS